MKELIDKIKKTGYWRVAIRPTMFKKTRILRLEDCKTIIESCRVSLRGWDYPHFGTEEIKISGNDSIESHCDWIKGGHFEYWRFYQSSQFVHYFSMREDYRMNEEQMRKVQDFNTTKSSKFLSILSTLYSINEIFLFAQRLAAKNVLGDDIDISIELGNSQGRELFFWDSFSRFLNRNYICTFRDENPTVKNIVPKEELIARYDKIALDACIAMFVKFNWAEPPRQVLEEDQRKFLQRQL